MSGEINPLNIAPLYDFKMTVNEPPLDRIIQARNKCAQIIMSHGEQFLPIFERLEKEILIRSKKQKTLERIQQIALEFGTQNGTHHGTQNHFENSNLKKIFNKNSYL